MVSRKKLIGTLCLLTAILSIVLAVAVARQSRNSANNEYVMDAFLSGEIYVRIAVIISIMLSGFALVGKKSLLTLQRITTIATAVICVILLIISEFHWYDFCSLIIAIAAVAGAFCNDTSIPIRRANVPDKSDFLPPPETVKGKRKKENKSDTDKYSGYSHDYIGKGKKKKKSKK